MVIKMNKAEALKMYKEVQITQGKHNGRWTNELDQEDSSIEYMEKMIDFAEKLKIDFDHNPKAYQWDQDEDPEEDETYFNYDAMGYELRCIIDKKLEDIILA